MTLLPKLLELNGVWLAVPFAEVLTLLVALGITYFDEKRGEE